jgi:hypothetical protein
MTKSGMEGYEMKVQIKALAKGIMAFSTERYALKIYSAVWQLKTLYIWLW